MNENKNAKTPADDGQPDSTLLYTAPPIKQWVGLTDRDIDECYFAARRPDFDIWAFAEEIEERLKEKNT